MAGFRESGPAARFWRGALGGLAGIAIAVWLFTAWAQVNSSTAGFAFLVVVLATATTSGLAAASAVSVAAMLCFNYFFLPPVGNFTIADPENWVALVTFLLTALVTSHLSDRARTQAIQARNSQRETEQLYALSRAILLTDTASPIGAQAARGIARIFEPAAVAILDRTTGEIHRGGPADFDAEPLLWEVARQGGHQRDGARGVDVWPIALGGNPIGAVAFLGVNASDGAVQSILNLVAIALERVRTAEAANRADAARQSEEFKSTLLDAIAHEFKTPLTSIKAAVTGLRLAVPDPPPDQNELTSIIDEETDRLSQLVSEAVKMAEIDAGKTAPKRKEADAAAILERARQSFVGRGGERVRIAAPPAGLPAIWADADLIVLALRQLIDNGLKHAGPDSAIECRAATEGERVVIRVIDQGPGVPERERERIFEKFHRSPRSRSKLPGSGLGLHIAREIARIHGGDLWLENGETRGAVFCLALPRREEAVA